MDLIVSHLEKSFGERRVLRAFDAVFPEGKLTCIMGRSGCGKTTLLNILLGLESPDSGTITGMPARRSCVFQEERLCEDFSAVTNVRIACAPSVKKSEIEAQLSAVGLADSLNQPVRELSGGMKRRVAIVRALMAPSDIVIMDEPLKGLDEATKQLVVSDIKQNLRGRTTIMVTHDEAEVALMGGILIRMPENGEDHDADLSKSRDY
jgi:NitT/TauT family transport system ATP-binding protein